MKIQKLLCTVLLLAMALMIASDQEGDANKEALQSNNQVIEQKKKWKIKNCFFANAVKDVVCLHGAIFHWDTFKIVASLTPVYMLTRMFDDDIQNNFYHGHCLKNCHKDVHQAPVWCAKLAQYSITMPTLIMFGSLFVGKSQEFRTTSWIYLLGMPFVIFGKDVFRKIRIDAAKRPWCGKFGFEEQSFGGFPSGHMAEATYLTVLYGMRFGVRAAGPLAIASTFLGMTFLNCNRHYISQLIAGLGVGTIFAFAANKVIDKKLANYHSHSIDLGMNVDITGRPAVTVGWHF